MELEELPHEGGKGHRTQTRCSRCNVILYTSPDFTKIEGCPRCFLRAPPAFTSPAEGAELHLGAVTLGWGAVEGATHYLLKVRDRTTGQILAGLPGAVRETHFTLDPGSLAEGHMYLAEVAAVSDVGDTRWAQSARGFKVTGPLEASKVEVSSTLEGDGTISAVVTWATNLPASSWVKVNGSRFGQDDHALEHRVELAGLAPEQPCAAEIESASGAGRSTVTRAIEIPRLWDVRMAVESSASDRTAFIGWRTSPEMDSRCVVGSQVVEWPELDVERRMTITGLAPVNPSCPPPAPYQVEIISKRVPGLSAATRKIDLPAIDQLQCSMSVEGATVTASVRWRTPHEMSSWVALGECEPFEWIPAEAGPEGAMPMTKEHRVTIRGCEPGRSYSAKVCSETKDGALRAEETFAFTT